MKGTPEVCIVDYGLGNLFSIKNACAWAGMTAISSDSSRDILRADIVILPGVGAFGDAISALHRLDLAPPIKDVAASQKPLIGICLGMQLLMTESYEFGRHPGLGLIPGTVVRFKEHTEDGGKLKVPHVGWNRIFRTKSQTEEESKPENQNQNNCNRWSGTPLEGTADAEYMYFVHSFFVQPEQSKVVLSTTKYGETEFCSSLEYNNIFASQFHPERSGPRGLEIYRSISRRCRIAEVGGDG